jgi:hypothetical protein
MKYIKTFESYSVNEEFVGLGILACFGAVLASGAIYDGIKKGYSKYVTGNKYEKTGKQVKLSSEKLKEQIISEYEDSDGNLYWGWDHQYNPELDTHHASVETGTMPTGDVYTGIFEYDDLEKLKKFILDFPNYSLRPEPVDFIYVKNIDNEISGDY